MAKVGDSITAENAHWSFGGNISDLFDEHVAKSVPFYYEGHDLIAKISDFVLMDGSVCYDLGCSTGTLLRILAERNKGRDVQFIGIDCEEGMVERAQRKCEGLKNVTIIKVDVADVEFKKADMIVAYYTFQFVRPKYRQLIFNHIYEALNWSGAFLLFEKVRACDARFQDITTATYTEYKLDRGYTPEEIVGKARSLKGVLDPFSTQGNLDLLRRAGFADILTVFKYVCFEGFLAIK